MDTTPRNQRGEQWLNTDLVTRERVCYYRGIYLLAKGVKNENSYKSFLSIVFLCGYFSGNFGYIKRKQQ